MRMGWTIVLLFVWAEVCDADKTKSEGGKIDKSGFEKRSYVIS